MKKLLTLLFVTASVLGSAPQEVTTLKQYQQVMAQDKPVVLFFYMPKCGACNKMKEPFSQLTKELAGQAYLVKINIDNKELAPIAQSYGITAVPTFFIRKVGAQPKDKLKSAILAAL